MPISIAAKLSADAGNGIRAGSDGGLLFDVVPQVLQSGYVIDNSWPTDPATMYWYVPQRSRENGFANFSTNTGMILPLVFAQDCTIGTSTIHQAIVASGTPTMHMAVYASSPTTGLPTDKIVDLMRWDMASTVGVYHSTPLAPAQVFTGSTLYWACVWLRGVSTYLHAQQGPPGMRATGSPGDVDFGQATHAYLDTTAAWSTLTVGPTTLTPVTNFSQLTSLARSTPVIYWGLTNA
jgi:hypothetical protein